MLQPETTRASVGLPVAVEPPRGRAPRGAELVRLRLTDRPGALASVAGHLAAYEIDLLRVEVLDREDGTAIDDLLVSGPRLGEALAALGGTATVLARREGVDLGDPALAMAAACEAVASARSERDAYSRVVRAALELVFAEAGLLCLSRADGLLAVVASTVPGLPLAVDGSGPSLVSSALATGQPLMADGRIPWAPADLRELLPLGSVVVVPGAEPASLVLAIVRLDHAPFARAELERLAALMRVTSASLGHLARAAAPEGRPTLVSAHAR